MSVAKHNLIPASDALLRTDLDDICQRLAGEFREMAGKRLLITGGAGFLGYYLVQSVLHWNALHSDAEPIEVTVFDNYIRGVPGWLVQLDGDPHLTLRKYDLIQPLPEDMADYQYIIHAAGIASPKYYRLRPLETMDANINGLRSLLEYCRRQEDRSAPVAGMLFFSSSEIYGDPTQDAIPTAEDFRGYVSCTGPRACYDESKRYGETLCVVFAQQYGVPVKMARPFNNYGPGLKITDRRVIPDFCRSVLANESIVMFSDGSPTRTFCYASDAIVGYYQVLVRGRAGEPYNIGSEGPEISMIELAEAIARLGAELTGYQGSVVRESSPEQNYLVDNPNRRCPLIAKARREIGYEPVISLEEGLRRTLTWYSHNPTAEDA